MKSDSNLFFTNFIYVCLTISDTNWLEQTLIMKIGLGSLLPMWIMSDIARDKKEHHDF